MAKVNEVEKFILTVEDVAQMLGVSREAVYMMIRRYGLPEWLLSRPLWSDFGG